jgi:hypothetical protein
VFIGLADQMDEKAIRNLVSNDLHRTMIVAVVAVRMVQMPGDEIIDMIPMRNRFVTATGAMNVSRIMSGAAMVGCASIRVLVAHFNPVFVHMVRVRMVKMAIVEIIHMAAVPDGNMTAMGAMHVIVIGVMRKIAAGHFDFLSLQQDLQARGNRAYPVVFGLNGFANIPFPRSQGTRVWIITSACISSLRATPATCNRP